MNTKHTYVDISRTVSCLTVISPLTPTSMHSTDLKFLIRLRPLCTVRSWTHLRVAKVSNPSVLGSTVILCFSRFRKFAGAAPRMKILHSDPSIWQERQNCSTTLHGVTGQQKLESLRKHKPYNFKPLTVYQHVCKSPRKPGFEFRVVHVELVVNKEESASVV